MAGNARIKAPTPASCTRTPRVQPRKYSIGSTCMLAEVSCPYFAWEIPRRSSHRAGLHAHPLPDLQRQESVDLVCQVPPARFVFLQQPPNIRVPDVSSLTDGVL